MVPCLPLTLVRLRGSLESAHALQSEDKADFTCETQMQDIG
jgi:hypothetical protein